MGKQKQKEDLRAEIEKQAIVHYFTMRDGVQVRVLEFDLAKKTHKIPLFFIPGFISVFQSWQEVIELLSKDFRIYYFESREKASSKMPSRKEARSVTLHKMAFDIQEVVEQLGLNQQQFVTLCSSTGGTIEVEALSEQWIQPAGAVMVGPTMEYNIKWIVPAFVSLIPSFVKTLMMPLVRWYLGSVYVDKNKEPEQYAKYVRAGEEAELVKIRSLLRKMRKYECWEMAPKVTTKTLLIGASNDKMHATEECLRAHELFPSSKYVDLGSNKATHSLPLVKEIKKFVEEIQ